MKFQGLKSKTKNSGLHSKANKADLDHVLFYSSIDYTLR